MKNNLQNNKEKIFSYKKYYILSVISTIVGWGLVFGFPASFAIGAVGVALGMGGFYSLLSVPVPKYTYSKPVVVKLDSGAEVKCTFIKMYTNFYSMFGLAFVFLKFLCPFYFIPASTKYFLLYNVDRATNESGKFENERFEELFEYLNGTELSRKRYKELMQNPQLFKDELAKKLAGQREVFFKVADKFEKNNLMTREECTDTYAVYKLSEAVVKNMKKEPSEDNLRVKFNFTGDNTHQKGFMVFKNLLDKGTSYEKQISFEDFVVSASELVNGQYFELNNHLFYNLTICKDTGEDSDNFVDIDTLEDTKNTDNRTIVTEEIVCRAARKKKKAGFLLLCIIVYYFAIACVAGVFAALTSVYIPGLLLAVALTVALFLLGNYLRKKAVPKKLTIDEVEIVKTYCTEKQTKIVNDNEVVFYTMANGLVVEDKGYNLKEKVVCYILYRKPENEIGWIYSSTQVKLASNLKVTDTIEK